MAYNAALVAEVLDCIGHLRVYGPRVMILRDDAEVQSTGGIIIPDEAQRTKKSGTIVKLGAGYEKIAEEENVEGITVGHRVTFNAYDGVSHAIPVNGREIEVLVMHAGNLYMGWTRTDGVEDV